MQGEISAFKKPLRTLEKTGQSWKHVREIQMMCSGDFTPKPQEEVKGELDQGEHRIQESAQKEEQDHVQNESVQEEEAKVEEQPEEAKVEEQPIDETKEAVKQSDEQEEAKDQPSETTNFDLEEGQETTTQEEA